MSCLPRNEADGSSPCSPEEWQLSNNKAGSDVLSESWCSVTCVRACTWSVMCCGHGPRSPSQHRIVRYTGEVMCLKDFYSHGCVGPLKCMRWLVFEQGFQSIMPLLLLVTSRKASSLFGAFCYRTLIYLRSLSLPFPSLPCSWWHHAWWPESFMRVLSSMLASPMRGNWQHCESAS